MRRRDRFAVCLLAGCLLALHPGFAPAATNRTFWVATTGSDTNGGTSVSDAWLTISNAVAHAGSNDTVWVSNGTYTISAQISVTNAIAIRGVGGDQTVVNGGGATPCFSLAHNGAVLDGLTVFNGYVAGNGAGINMTGGTVLNCTIVSNRCANGMFYGNGIYMSGGSVSNCVIRFNDSPVSQNNFGGGVYISGGTLQYSTIASNRAYGSTRTAGGGVQIDGGLIRNSLIVGNNAQGASGSYGTFSGGGGVKMNGGTLRNCIIAGNQATAGHADSKGGGVRITGGTIENCTIVRNAATASTGGGVYQDGGAITNCIVYYNTSLAGINNLAAGQVFYCDSPELGNANSNIVAAPGFCNAGSGSGLSAVYGDYHLLPRTPCVNTGTNLAAVTRDYEDNFRPLDGDGDGAATHDIGAYEVNPTGGHLRCNFSASTNWDFGSVTAVFTAYVEGLNTNGLVYYWAFDNDGTLDTNGAGLGVVTNTYAVGGLYTVSLTVSNAGAEGFTLLQPNSIAVLTDTDAYVATNGSHTSPFDTWGKAATNIQAAVDIMQALVAGGGTHHTVWVSNGIYAVSAPVSITRDIVLCGTNGPAVTLVNGNATTQCFSVNSPGAVLNGLCVSNGLWTSDGSGVYLANGTLANCVITGCRNLRAVNMVGGSLVGCSIINNTNGNGGGLVMSGGTAQDCTITNNYGGTPGAGVSMTAGTLAGSMIAANRNQAVGSQGHGICIAGGLVTNCVIRNNGVPTALSDTYAGGVYMTAGSLVDCTVVSNLLWGSNRNSGGGVWLNGTGAVVDRCVIAYNEARGAAGNYIDYNGGGGVTMHAGLLRNCLIACNLVNGGVVQHDGGGVRMKGGRMENCTIVGNCATNQSDGGGVYREAGAITNCIIYFNTVRPGGTVGNIALGSAAYSCAPELTSGTGNLAADPQFRKAGAGAGTNATLGDYHLGLFSPCVDAGASASASNDLDGIARPLDGNGDGTAVTDMGCYEMPTWNFATLSVVGDPLPHGWSEPYNYGLTALSVGTVVTNQVNSPVDELNGARYVCLGWRLTNEQGLVDSDVTTQAVFTANTDLWLTWRWTNQWYLTTAVSSTNGGLQQDMTGWYTNGVKFTLTATANVNYAFLTWSGPGVPLGHNTDNPITLTMDQARSITANFVSILPQIKFWDGTNMWFAATNWTPAGIPGVNDTCIIRSGRCTLTDPVSVACLTVSNGAALLFTNWHAILMAANVTVLSNAVITHALCNTNTVLANTNRIVIVCSNLTVLSGGALDVSRKGFAGAPAGGAQSAGQGPGGGGGSYGGAYGGVGARGTYSGSDGRPYGSAAMPDQPGSGGGGIPGVAGGAGGGVVRIEAADQVVINGSVVANGEGINNPGGDGSGGGIYIACRTIGGTNGVIAADAGDANGSSDTGGGGGGGGRIAIVYDPAAESNWVATFGRPSLTISANQGWGSVAAGRPGTLYFPDTTIYPGPAMQGGAMVIPGVTSWSAASLIISNGLASFPTGMIVNITSNVVVLGAAGFEVSNGVLAVGGKLDLTNVSVRSASYLYGDPDRPSSIGGDVTVAKGALRFSSPTRPATLNVGGNLMVTNGGRFLVESAATNGSAPVFGSLIRVAGDLVVAPASTIMPFSHLTNGASPCFVVNNVRVDAGGVINAQGTGFDGAAGWPPLGRGWGPGGGYGSAGGSMAGYGAIGGGGGTLGVTYGNSNAPVLIPGSGGGVYSFPGYNGARGGGLVWIEAARQATINGTINANGMAMYGPPQSGGSGGSIYISCRRLEGAASGLLSANGGDAASASSGAGGGGQITVKRALDHYVGQVTVMGGTGTYAGQPGLVVWLPLPQGLVMQVSPVGGSADMTNAVPYAESFEEYPVGFPMNETGSWSSGVDDLAIVTNQACGYAGVYPLADSAHIQTLDVAGYLTNCVVGSPNAVAYVDLLVQCGYVDELPPFPVNAQAACFVNTNGHLVVRHTVLDTLAEAWAEIPDTMVGPDEWVRITVTMDYQTPDARYDWCYYQIALNGVTLTNEEGYTTNDGYGAAGGSWFPMGQGGGQRWVSGVAFVGQGAVDDLVVTDQPPDLGPYWIVTAAGSGAGTIEPASALVRDGDSASFTIRAAEYYYLASIHTNGIAADVALEGAVTNWVYVWSNVTAHAALQVAFAPLCTTNGTPLYWLAAHKLGRDDDDPDQDGLRTWQEYLAGTDPTNNASALRLSAAGPVGPGAYLIRWASNTNRYYRVGQATNLHDGFFLLRTNIPATPPFNVHTGALENPGSFYRIELEP